MPVHHQCIHVQIARGTSIATLPACTQLHFVLVGLAREFDAADVRTITNTLPCAPEPESKYIERFVQDHVNRISTERTEPDVWHHRVQTQIERATVEVS